jgi:hypothetical protein
LQIGNSLKIRELEIYVSSTVLSLNIRPRNHKGADTNENIPNLLLIVGVGVSLLCFHANADTFLKLQIVKASLHAATML